MDNRTTAPSAPANSSMHELFSRGSTPPVQQPQPQYVPPAHLSHNMSSNQIDSLFQHLNTSSSSEHSHSQQSTGSYGSTPTTPMNDEPVSSPPTAQSITDRQNALLSMLSGAPSVTQAGAVQIPTPPGSSQRSNASPTSAEVQGKLLLEQLMSGKSTYSESPQSSHNVPIHHAPSSPYPARDPSEYYDPIELTEISRPEQQQQKTMFDFVSPFEALSSPAVKKKPVPSVSSAEDSGWTAVSDPKRRSVDNLLEQMSNLRPYPQSVSGHYDFYDPTPGDYRSQQEPPPPIPPKPLVQRPESPQPRLSPPKVHAQRARLNEPATTGSQQASIQGSNAGKRDKESSPGPRGSVRRGRGGKNFVSPSVQPQTIIFDVSQPLDEIQASRDFVKSTAIALVKQETVFLPGTTIGATHWVAYAMSRGRVRVISRSNGDRTLLQLPPIFGNASVTDMAVHGNRLAGVTTDGGFVVWELPDVITDDVPGHLILCVAPPTPEMDPLMSVKWNPKEPDTLAVASENQVYLIDLANVAGLHDGPISQSDLRHLGHCLTLSSTLVSFDFDILQQALITISVDSMLTTWNILDQVPYSSVKIRGEDTPSSLTYADGVIVVGRRFGTVFQLLSANTRAILSTIKFVNSAPSPDDVMFGHVCYDARIQTLWIANSKRESIIAFKLNIDSPVLGDEPGRGFIDQVIEFSGPKPTIHFVILTVDADPRGDEAYAACIAAKVTPSELALAGFSVHSSGVDQILIRKEWFLEALATTQSKYPIYVAPTAVSAPEVRSQKQQAPAPVRPRTPQSEEVDVDIGRDDVRASEPKGGKGQKGKNVSWGGGKEDNGSNGKGKEKEKEVTDAPVGAALTKEMKKMEDNLHTRITRTLNKEMDKQHQRFEDARAHEQAEDFARQEKILKLISTELTRNTTRVVEVAVKNEVQNSVLPALESITKSEVKTVLTDQVGRAMNDLVTRRLPAEMENLLLRPEFANKLSQALANNLSVIIDRQVKDAVSQVVVPEIIAIKDELSRWQSEAHRQQEASISQLERTIRTLSDQVKFLTSRAPSGTPPQKPPPPPMNIGQGNSMNQSQMQPRMSQQMPPLPHPGSMSQVPQQPPPNWYPHDPNSQPAWYGGGRGIAAPQPSHPAQPPPTVEKQVTLEEMSKYEDQFLEALASSNTSKDLITLLARSNMDTVMPLRPDAPTLSQTIVIVIIHRNTSIIDTTAPSDMAFKVAIQWLQRALLVLRLDDHMMLDYIPKVMPTTYRLLGIAEKRLALLPDKSPSTMDAIHHLRDVRRVIEQKIPNATKQSDATNAGPSNAGQV